MARLCKLCGAEIEAPKPHQMYCNNAECVKKRNEIYAAKSAENKRERERARKEAKARASIAPGKSLDRMAREAHSLGLSYGQYSALIAGGTLRAWCKFNGKKMPK